jgi:hypothetical protein
VTATFTDLLIRIYSRPPDQPIYRVDAELEDGSVFSQGELRLDEETLASRESTEEYGQQLFKAYLMVPSARPTIRQWAWSAPRAAVRSLAAVASA